MDKFKLPARLSGSNSKPSVWNEFTAIQLKHKPIDLGQGCPNYLAPKHITDILDNIQTIQCKNDSTLNQYTRSSGHPRLVNALAALYSKLIYREIDPETEILTTFGAYEALYSTIQGHVEIGDEVIIIEPFFDCYQPMVESAGGIPKFIPLKPKKGDGLITSADWVLNEEELESLFNNKTKMIIINTPQNPIGKVYSLAELSKIAELCKKWNVLCVSDEVYEWLVYDKAEHIRICTLPGMWEKTITIGSAGKTFFVTGWKVGWAYGSASLIENLQKVHELNLNCCNTPVQEAIAVGFEIETGRLNEPSCYFNVMCKELCAKRDFMMQFLKKSGLKPILPEGGFFMLVDWSSIESKIDLSKEMDKSKDYRFAKWILRNYGLQVIPPTAFYSDKNKNLVENYARLCFIKDYDTLQKAKELFEKL